ncbi:hypothetical protein BC831DRAFT_16377 [Entophlyctis helioformis]|nr:hypothetical protein BC831DRAFT_16377 [Entophlyctis helioformis]
MAGRQTASGAAAQQRHSTDREKGGSLLISVTRSCETSCGSMRILSTSQSRLFARRPPRCPTLPCQCRMHTHTRPVAGSSGRCVCCPQASSAIDACPWIKAARCICIAATLEMLQDGPSDRSIHNGNVRVVVSCGWRHRVACLPPHGCPVVKSGTAAETGGSRSGMAVSSSCCFCVLLLLLLLRLCSSTLDGFFFGRFLFFLRFLQPF